MAKQRQIRIDNRSAVAAMTALETKSDEELLAETKYKSAAMAILGARAAERYDAKAARGYFQRAIAAARPQERMQLRRMADASLALAERRPDDLKQAVERLGQTPPTSRQLFVLRLTGLLVPPPGAGILARIRGIFMLLLLVAVLLGIGFGIAQLIGLAFGGISVGGGLLLGFVIVVVALGVLALLGRRRQAAARDKARAGYPRAGLPARAGRPPSLLQFSLPRGGGYAWLTGRYDRFSMILTWRMVTGWRGRSPVGSDSLGGPVGVAAIAFTAFIPLTTRPRTAYSGGSPASSAVTMKNWLPEVPGASACVLAIATTPRVYCVERGGASTTLYPGPPWPVPWGSPPWMTKSPVPGLLAMRWNVSLS